MVGARLAFLSLGHPGHPHPLQIHTHMVCWDGHRVAEVTWRQVGVKLALLPE